MNSSEARSSSAAAPRAVHRFFEFSLLGMLAAGYLAVFSTGTLDWPTVFVAASGLCVRALMACGVIRFELPPRMVAALTLFYIGFFPLDYYYLSPSFLAATVHMVFFLATLKLITAATPRDYSILKLVAGLELIAAAILSTGLSFLVFLTMFVLFAIATFTSAEVRRAAAGRGLISRGGTRGFARRLGWLSGSLFVGILVMTAALFFVLPRTARAAFERFAFPRLHLAGFSNSVTLGEIGQIKQSSAAVMHVRSYQGEGFLPVKWRGAALAEFDGRRWFNPPGEDQLVRVDGGVIAVRAGVQGLRAGRSLIYQVHLSPTVADTLFFGGNPETISIDVPFLRYSRGGSFHVSPRFGVQGLNYGVYGFLPDEWAEVRFTSAPLGISTRAELLSVPELDPRIPELARQMTRGAESDIEKARAMESHLRRDYGYTLELLTKPVADPLAYFLFERRKGHCEYFASAMAVMLRTLGIPSRVVTGFQSGVYNSMTGWQVVRASDAHSWVEAWLEGRGWTTFDPTPSDPAAGQKGLLSKFSLWSDTAQQFWQDWVMSYDMDHQVALASSVQAEGRRFRLPNFAEVAGGFAEAGRVGLHYGPAVVGAIAMLVLLLLMGPAAARWWRKRVHAQKLERGEGKPSDATILYQQMLGLLQKRGIQKPPWLTPAEFAHGIPAPEIAALVDHATCAYNELRFGGRREAAPRMMAVLAQIEKL